MTIAANASPQLKAALKEVSAEMDRRFDALLPVPNDPRAELYRAMRHATIGGGKRLRPLLVFATARLFDVARDAAGRVATALEAIHVYSLIHDDLPAMDDDDLRHGKATVHKAFDEATAILAGDCLHALAFEVLADPATHADPFVRAELIADLARASGPSGMAGGQAMDLKADGTRFDLNTVTRLQQMKTGALIGAAVEGGAILGRVPPEGRRHLRGYAHDLGLAFQIVDDLLDVEGDEQLAGKKLRKDGEQGKETFVSLLGVDRARQQSQMLVDQAIDHLRSYGPEADLLRAIARFVIDRRG
ncbi:polyprenyl synthetase family protein [Sphingomonas phyllosphaerae]|uniref:polyprenyl synthetase family protein n=1 Tax=Sphingomonas phyllosphaerae TaxID=257003 RepID=UPI0003B61BD8|nr:farnesyl diphosphate synthase [Sphingomonas phyllosphaerae]